MLCQEKTIHIQMQNSDYLVKNNLLYWYESVFLQFCLVQLTDCCLVQLTDFVVRGTDKGFCTRIILIDLQKAFDMLDHTVLLQKWNILVL